MNLLIPYDWPAFVPADQFDVIRRIVPKPNEDKISWNDIKIFLKDELEIIELNNGLILVCGKNANLGKPINYRAMDIASDTLLPGDHIYGDAVIIG